MSRRDQIRMSDNEIDAFLDEQRIVTVATLGRSGRPHLLPLWYTAHTPTRIDCWTFAASQKVVNLRALPQATLQVEAGDSYEQLCGVSMECDVELVDELDRVAEIGLGLSVRYTDGITDDNVPEELKQFVAKQAKKRVGLRFHPTHVISWDHRKLGGVY